jgi:hypothetical protein
MTTTTSKATKKRGAYKKKEQTFYWDYETQLNAVDFIKRITDMLLPPLRNMQDMPGDMYMSDYMKLSDAYFRLKNARKDESYGGSKR